jgi:anti-sigma factor RsiW
MACERYLNAIHELIDGTLGQIRRAELELHLESCDDCRALADDLRVIARASGSLGPMEPPARVWTQIAGRLRQEGLVRSSSASTWRSRAVLPLAAALVLAVGASLFVVWPRSTAAPPASSQSATDPDATEVPGNAEPEGAVQGIDAELTKTVGHLENAVEQATKLGDSLDPQTKVEIQKNLLVINEAVEATRAALKNDPQDATAQQSLYETLKQKIQFLQNTITLMNEMRQGDAAGAAQIVESGKS